MLRPSTLALTALWLWLPPALPAQEVVAVVSSAPGPYQAAYASFAAAFGGPFATVRLPAASPSAPSGTLVVVSFGGEAALTEHPPDVFVIACLAPGLGERTLDRGRASYVAMKPPPVRLLSELRRVQPGLRRLGVLVHGRDTAHYLVELRRAGEALGVEIVAARVRRAELLPDALRDLLPKKVDAVWLPPEPGLVTPDAFETLARFSWDNRIPFYAPTRGLAAAGASAAVFVPVDEIGRVAGDLARRALAGERLPRWVYPERTKLAINPASAKKAGLAIPDSALLAGDEVLP